MTSVKKDKVTFAQFFGMNFIQVQHFEFSPHPLVAKRWTAPPVKWKRRQRRSSRHRHAPFTRVSRALTVVLKKRLRPLGGSAHFTARRASQVPTETPRGRTMTSLATCLDWLCRHRHRHRHRLAPPLNYCAAESWSFHTAHLVTGWFYWRLYYRFQPL